MGHMYRFTIRGRVQGVGFRPTVQRACAQAGVVGYVRNISTGAEIVADQKTSVEHILRTLPPTMRIDSVRIDVIDDTCEGFTIRESRGKGYAELPSDLYLCEECLRELFDPQNRRFGYFFMTCTNCGPRFTMMTGAPYDREHTTMRSFPLCEECRKEYHDPHDRRYHAQTIACPTCGPRLRLLHYGNCITEGTDESIIAKTAHHLYQGEIVAIKGLGGFHLVCTTAPRVVQQLKNVTGRTDKPFAVLCRDVAMAKRLAEITEEEIVALTSVERPIVLLSKKQALPEVTELATIGIMLPSSALQYLLFTYLDEPLIVTSANRAGAPISLTSGEQLVPWVLDHTRSIAHAADDSLVKVIADEPRVLRRSRGYVPRSFLVDAEPQHNTILGCGAEMNSVFALLHDGVLTPSQYMGNCAQVDVMARYEDTVHTFLRTMHAQPEVVCIDLHPDYTTSHFGRALAERVGAKVVTVQHHMAHAYCVAFENGLEDFVGIICDGSGYGEDSSVWGGEVLGREGRLGHLEQHPLLGGDSAVQYPRKMAYSMLRSFLSHTEAVRILGDVYTTREYELLKVQWDHRIASPNTSSCGRVIDAAAALLGLCAERTYEGRPALLLESISTDPYVLSPVIEGNVLRTGPLFSFLVHNLHRDHGRLAATVFQYLAEGLYEIACTYAKPIVFGGGCAANAPMARFMRGQGVYTNRQLPPGDGGISVGQVVSVLYNHSS